jgi:hypothetical protein
MTSRPAAPPRVRGWATSALWAGVAWVVLALAPVPVTTLLGLPFAAAALLGGWVSAREGRAAGDPVAVRRARWSMGLGCAGFVYLLTFYLVAGTVLIAGLAAAASAAWQRIQ